MTQSIDLLNSSINPFLLFKQWFDAAKEKEINDPNAMNLSTISQDSKPSSRMVLLKEYSEDGFVFYTNSRSKKGKSIYSNPYVSLNFHWKSLLRQVRIEGKVIQVSNEEADKYYNSRPLESRIGAWASSQSEVLKQRKDLQDKIEFYKNKFKIDNIIRPPHWKGFRVEPNLIEFWQDMPFRLHDRLEYTRIKNQWTTRKLYP